MRHLIVISHDLRGRGGSGSTELAFVVSRRSRSEISLWKAADRHKERPEGTVGGNKSSTGGTKGLEERMPEGSRVSRFLGICCWEFHHRYALLISPNASEGYLSEHPTNRDLAFLCNSITIVYRLVQYFSNRLKYLGRAQFDVHQLQLQGLDSRLYTASAGPTWRTALTFVWNVY